MTRAALELAKETIAVDEAAVTGRFIAFLRDASERRHPSGPIRRFNQGRDAGCVEAEFVVRDDLPPEHRVGLFAEPRTYRAFVRFANASSSTDREKDLRGMSIALSDVDGHNLTPTATRQDFVLNSHPVMVAPDTKEFLALLQAMEGGGLRRLLYFASHPGAARIGLAARQQPTCHLDISYWSTTPYLFSPGRAVKYIAKPCSQRTSRLPERLTDAYLRDALRAHLAQDEACFDFMIQFQLDGREMPIEDATVEWKEQRSPYLPVARLRIPRQGIDDAARLRSCEEIAFNPWNCLTDHRPLGGLNRARKDIYHSLAQLRRDRA